MSPPTSKSMPACGQLPHSDDAKMVLSGGGEAWHSRCKEQHLIPPKSSFIQQKPPGTNIWHSKSSNSRIFLDTLQSFCLYGEKQYLSRNEQNWRHVFFNQLRQTPPKKIRIENQIKIFRQELRELYSWNRQVLFHFPPPFCADFGVTVVMTKTTSTIMTITTSTIRMKAKQVTIEGQPLTIFVPVKLHCGVDILPIGNLHLDIPKIRQLLPVSISQVASTLT